MALNVRVALASVDAEYASGYGDVRPRQYPASSALRDLIPLGLRPVSVATETRVILAFWACVQGW